MKINSIYIILIIAIIVTLIALFMIPDNTTTTRQNQLSKSNNPYLLQHANNPVHWQIFSDDIKQQAIEENKIVMLSFGYSTCYWCHVLEREVFENDDFAKLVNDKFIMVKIDREAMPVLDDIYMNATQIITGSGGWPNNVFTTPDLKPFYAVTYLPLNKFKDLVTNINEVWQQDPSKVKQDANKITQYIKAQNSLTKNTAEIDLDKSFSSFYDSYDFDNQGFGQGTKFPNETNLLFLSEYQNHTQDNTAKKMLNANIETILSSGLTDHIEGGFHRYTTDSKWQIPHFEKMLYNQALINEALIYQINDTGIINDLAPVIQNHINFLISDFQDKNGGFYSAFDAESNHTEGEYYVINKSELDKALTPKELELFNDFFQLIEMHVYPGHNAPDGYVVVMNKNIKDIAKSQWQQINKLTEKIKAKIRINHDKPFLDKKIITAWNGLAIYTILDAYETLKNDEYLASAEKAIKFISKNHIKNNKLYRLSYNGKISGDAILEDYAYFIRALAKHYKITNSQSSLNLIDQLIDELNKDFADSKGAYFENKATKNNLVRVKKADDSAIPSSNAILSLGLVELYQTTRNIEYLKIAENIIEYFSYNANNYPLNYATLLRAYVKYQNVTKSNFASKDVVKITSSFKDNKLIINGKIDQGYYLYAKSQKQYNIIPLTILPDNQQFQISPIKQKQINNQNFEILTEKFTIEIATNNPENITLKLQACNQDNFCLLPNEIKLKP